MEKDWKPTPRQIEALKRTEFEILYGGARGGGKTDAGMGFLTYDFEHPLYRALVIRKNADDLKDWLDRAGRFYARVGASIIGREVRFPKGAIIRTGHLKDDNAYMKYQGHEYQKMLIEEVTQISSETNYKKLIASCRSTIPELRPQVFDTANPDGPGFNLVKKRFKLRGILNKIISMIDEETGLSRVFIPAKVQDNPYLMDNDPNYLSMLNGLPDGLREAWRDGSWEEPVIPGAYYAMALLQARKEGRVKQISYDPSLLVHTVWDLGIGEQLVCGFFQVFGDEIRLIDIWQGEGSDGIPQAKMMLDGKNYIYGKHFGPHDLNKTQKRTGQTIFDTAKALGLNFEEIPMVRVTHRLDKALLLFPRLWINEPLCDQFLVAIRQFRKKWNEQRLDWEDEPFKDWTNHFADMFSYAAMIIDQMTNEFMPLISSHTPAWVSKRWQKHR